MHPGFTLATPRLLPVCFDKHKPVFRGCDPRPQLFGSLSYEDNPSQKEAAKDGKPNTSGLPEVWKPKEPTFSALKLRSDEVLKEF